MATWPVTGATDWNAKMLAFLAVSFNTDGTLKLLAALPKAWVSFNSAGTVQESYNVTSVVRNAEGQFTITWDTDFAAATYAVIASAGETQIAGVRTGTIAAGSVQIWTSSHAGVATDPVWCSVTAYGAQ